MPKVHNLQSAFNAGLLDPRLAARIDLSQYYQGMSEAENVVTLPLGGVRRRPGMALVDRVLRPLSRILDGAIGTAPNGGTAGNALDEDRSTFLITTTDVGTLDPYVVLHVDRGTGFASTFEIRMADVFDISSSDGSTDRFRIQSSADDSTWTDFGERFEVVSSTPRTFRRRGASTDRYWRVVKVGGADMGTVDVRLSGFSLLQENADLLGNDASGQPRNRVRLVPFEFSVNQTYLLAGSLGNIAVYRDGELKADVPGQLLPDFDYAQQADTMVIVSAGQAPQRLVRRRVPGDNTIDTHWQIDPIAFTSIPQFDFNDADSPTPVAEVQSLNFAGGDWKAGDRFELELDGSVTRTITYGGVSSETQRTQTAENIRRELQKLPTVLGDGIAVAFIEDTKFGVTFADASANNYGVMGAFPVSGDSGNFIAVQRNATGSSRRESAWSDLRGWPTSVTFAAGRMWLGGTAVLPTSFWASTAFDLFDFDTGEGLPDEAIFNTLLSERLNAIVHIFAGRDLTLFTTGSEARFPSDVLTPENAIPAIQTRYGVARIKPVTIDGATLFIQRTRKVLRNFVFDVNQDAYLAAPLTALAPFVLNDVQDMDAWLGSGDDDSNLVFCVNGDGTLAVLNTLRSQDINSWCKWTTDGLVKSVAVVDQTIYFATLRSSDEDDGSGNKRDINYIEELRRDHFTDNSVRQTLATPGAVVPGLVHLDTVLCRVRADGNVLTNATPAGGQITVELDVTDVEVGRNFDCIVKPMPLNADFGNGDNFLRKKRVVKLRMLVFETLGVRFQGSALPDRDMDVSNYDTPPAPFTGALELEDTSGWSFDSLTPEIAIRDPVPFTLLGFDIQVETS